MAWRLLLPSTLATWGVDNGYPDTGYPTLATQKADTGYPTLATPTLVTSHLLGYLKWVAVKSWYIKQRASGSMIAFLFLCSFMGL
jgi:hypothetical protein